MKEAKRILAVGDHLPPLSPGPMGGRFDFATVRKQIWRAEHPERFYPTIDSEWQKEQLAREGYVP